MSRNLRGADGGATSRSGRRPRCRSVPSCSSG